MRVAAEIHLTKSQRATLQQWSRGRKVAVRQAQRAEMILRAAKGKSNQEIAAQLGVTEKTIKAHRARVMRKMQAKSLADLVRMAERVGL